MELEQIAPLTGEIAASVVTILLIIFRHQEFFRFLWKIGQLIYKPIGCIVKLIKLAPKLGKDQDELKKTVSELNSFVRAKLNYNGGSSLPDALRRIENQLFVFEAKSIALLNDDKKGLFYCDLSGHNTWVNRTYARFLGCGQDELLGYGWKSFIKTQELARYNKIWVEAFKDGCEFEDTVEFSNAQGHKIGLNVEMSAVKNSRGETISYLGQVTAL